MHALYITLVDFGLEGDENWGISNKSVILTILE